MSARTPKNNSDGGASEAAKPRRQQNLGVRLGRAAPGCAHLVAQPAKLQPRRKVVIAQTTTKINKNNLNFFSFYALYVYGQSRPMKVSYIMKSTADNSHSIHYAELLKNWPKGIGPKPTNEMFAVAHACGKNLTGKKHAITIAMAQRPLGVTDYEHIVAIAQFSNVALHQQKNLVNYLRDACLAGFLVDNGMAIARRVNPLSGKSERVWQVKLTDPAAFAKGILPAITERAELKAAPLRAKAKAAKQAARDAAKATRTTKRKAKAKVIVDAPDTFTGDATFTADDVADMPLEPATPAETN
jgi:ElaB/YqjD/DUF883 family membrane-anchored ribosome-binding protein